LSTLLGDAASQVMSGELRSFSFSMAGVWL